MPRARVSPSYDVAVGRPDLLEDLDTEQILTCGICFDRFRVSTLAAFADWVAPSNIITLPCRKRHSYCLDCLRAYLHSTLEAEPTLARDGSIHQRTSTIPCPGCAMARSTSNERIFMLDDALVESFLSREDILRWRVWKIAESTNFLFCPNPTCSELIQMPDPSDEWQCGRCPRCASGICARCRVLWHKNMTCDEYRSTLTAMTDPQLARLIRQNRWCRCPNCKAIVERTAGCRHMRCICTWEFCYRCGADWDIVLGMCGGNPGCRGPDEVAGSDGGLVFISARLSQHSLLLAHLHDRNAVPYFYLGCFRDFFRRALHSG